MKIHIVGLNNPGVKYEKTRHNIGRDIVHAFHEKHGLSSFYVPGHGDASEADGVFRFEKRFAKKVNDQNEQGEVVYERKVVEIPYTVVLPNTFMNLSGKAVSHYVKKASDAMRLVVVHDELDIVTGDTKVTTKRGHGGNNGVRDIVRQLGTNEFTRLRVGIGRADKNGQLDPIPYKGLVEKYVLEKFESHQVWEDVVNNGVMRLEELLKHM